MEAECNDYNGRGRFSGLILAWLNMYFYVYV